MLSMSPLKSAVWGPAASLYSCRSTVTAMILWHQVPRNRARVTNPHPGLWMLARRVLYSLWVLQVTLKKRGVVLSPYSFPAFVWQNNFINLEETGNFRSEFWPLGLLRPHCVSHTHTQTYTLHPKGHLQCPKTFLCSIKDRANHKLQLSMFLQLSGDFVIIFNLPSRDLK